MARRAWTDASIGSMKPKAKRFAVPDPILPGHYVRVQPSGARSFVVVARDPRGKQKWFTIGTPAELSVEEAQAKARKAIKAIKLGEDTAPPESFTAVAASWLERYVDKKGLRSRREIERHLGRMNAAWGARNFADIRRGDVTKFLDHIEDNHGVRQADYALAVISGLTNWYAKRHENYSTPIVRGMQRRSAKETARKRILNDDELRAVWKAAEGNGAFGAIVRLLLLSGQRLDKVLTLRWDDLDGNVWTIPSEAREKGNAGVLILPEIAMEIINAQPRFASNPYVFAGRRDKPLHVSHKKAALNAKLGEMEPWVLHDLRRTARSLMSRAGVRPDIAERVLGHAIQGVEGVYDRHSYLEQKGHALRALAGLIETLINPPVGNVLQMAAAQ
jgi:integrase